MKKIVSIILASLLFATGSISAFAYSSMDKECISVDEAIAEYEKENNTKVETFRHYFMLPDENTVLLDSVNGTTIKSWFKNPDCTPCICWWEGENCPIPDNWVGYKMTQTDVKNIWYADIPVNAASMFMINDGREPDKYGYGEAYDSVYLGKNYPFVYGKYEDYNNKILVLTTYSNPDCSSMEIFSGDLYCYYGDSCYGDKEKGFKNTTDCLNPEHKHTAKPPVKPTNSPTKPIVKKANPVKASVKAVTVKAKTLKSKKAVKKAVAVKKAKGKVCINIQKITLKGKKVSAKTSKKFSINSKGNLTIGKATKKGNYKLTVKITAQGNSKYKSKTITKTVKVKIK